MLALWMGCLAPSALLVSHKDWEFCGIFAEWAITRMHHLGTPYHCQPRMLCWCTQQSSRSARCLAHIIL